MNLEFYTLEIPHNQDFPGTYRALSLIEFEGVFLGGPTWHFSNFKVDFGVAGFRGSLQGRKQVDDCFEGTVSEERAH